MNLTNYLYYYQSLLKSGAEWNTLLSKRQRLCSVLRVKAENNIFSLHFCNDRFPRTNQNLFCLFTFTCFFIPAREFSESIFVKRVFFTKKVVICENLG